MGKMYEAPQPKGMVVYPNDWAGFVQDYEREEIGAMVIACLTYFCQGEVTEFEDRGMRQFFRQCVKSIDLGLEQHLKKCWRNAYNNYQGQCKDAGIEPIPFEKWKDTMTVYGDVYATVVKRESSTGTQSHPLAPNTNMNGNNNTNTECESEYQEEREWLGEGKGMTIHDAHKQRTDAELDKRRTDYIEQLLKASRDSE